MNNILTTNNIFPLKITSGEQQGKWIIYLPLAGYACIGDSSIISDLTKALTQKPYTQSDTTETILSHLKDEPKPIYTTEGSIHDLSTMMILPNNKCNFHCSYCYSAGGRNGKEISPDTLKSAIAYFLDPSRNNSRKLAISILGGGEPLLSPQVWKPALDYAYTLANQNERNLSVSLITNGSIVSEETIRYCKEKNIYLSISFDVLEDIQNQQRGHYDLVKDNINKCTEAGLDVAINTVITRDNVHRMEEMINHMADVLPKVKKILFKSLISDTYFPDVKSRIAYYQQFVDNFFAAQAIAQSYGIYLTSHYQNVVICLADRYCSGKFVVTAEGTISICPLVSSSQDRFYDKFIYGTITPDKTINIDSNKLKSILSHDQNKLAQCIDCPAKWHCAGGCYMDYCGMSAEEHEAYCVSMRYFLEKYLLQNIIK